jgi:hypothetical protein
MTRFPLAGSMSVVLILCGCGTSSKPSSDSATSSPDAGWEVAPDSGCAPGTLHCACMAGNTCASGLVCQSNTCVGNVATGGSLGSGGSTGAGGTGGTISTGGSGGGGGFAGASMTGGSGGGGGFAGASMTGGSGGGGGFAGATTAPPDAGSTTDADRGEATSDTGTAPLPDGATIGLDTSAQADAPTAEKPDGADADARPADGLDSSGGEDGGQFGCQATTTGCLCQPNFASDAGLSTCSKASVSASAADRGRCCQTSSYCACDSVSCLLDTATGRCYCDFTELAEQILPSGTKVDECPAPEPSGHKCCYDAVGNYCECMHATCSGTTTEIATCALTALTACGSSELAVDSCR